MGEGAGQRDALLLPARKLVGVAPCPPSEPDQVEQLGNAVAPAPRGVRIRRFR